ATALALPGWGGMFSRLERHPEDNPDGPPVTLVDFLAVRLLLERHAVERACKRAGVSSDWSVLRTLVPAPAPRAEILDASILWGIMHAAGVAPTAALAIEDQTLAALWHEYTFCAPLRRRQLFQNAYERTYRRGILDALFARRALSSDAIRSRPRAQFVFCIDEREESIRRALEEQHPDYITFGMAGFFGVAIDFQGLYDREPAAYCPVVVTPGHEVYEQPVYTDLGRHLVSQRWRNRWHAVERRAVAASRSLSGGVGMSFLVGPLSVVKTLARVVAPRSSVRFGVQVATSLAPRPATRLSTLRLGDSVQVLEGQKPVGFSLEESIDRVTASLTNLGLVRDFAPIVVFLGHGSTSLNNPHESAHDCGACGGRRGGANARLFADMANRPDVRDGVRKRGIDIPADTWFVGALHDTSDDSVRYYDLERLPQALVARFDEAHEALERARREDARERSRRFHDAPLTVTPEGALLHVEARAAHLAQPRPEYGHCTNSICIVGRRVLTRGLHLDRRPFLVSYDPTIDNDHKILERILAAVGPVGAGISLEYYFSSVDNETFGCGTKLPHNVTGLIGVMNGHQSDLRTGLPLQMVEIHEPMRLLIVVDATPEALLAVAGRQAEVAELVVNEWVQLVSADPDTGAMQVFEGGQFV
ncbi:MAG: putative inorganic carbon transporter subunit DabA, partial [Gemmatimonas sp.]